MVCAELVDFGHHSRQFELLLRHFDFALQTEVQALDGVGAVAAVALVGIKFRDFFAKQEGVFCPHMQFRAVIFLLFLVFLD